MTGSLDQAVELTVYGAEDWPRLSPEWRTLAEQSSHTSFFLTVEWIDAWMTAFGPVLRPDILAFRSGGRLVGACLLVERSVRVGPFSITRVFLNTAGEDDEEDTTIEYNGLLCLDDWREAVVRCFAGYLGRRKWDEFFADGLSPGTMLDSLRALCFEPYPQSVRVGRSFYMDLAAARDGARTFEQCLGARSRKNIRRYLNLYRAIGEVRTEVPADVAGALAMLDEMIALHQETWRLRGRPGAFASPRVLTLHRELVRQTFSAGGTQLLRVSAGNEVVGIAYNLILRGKVYAYQQGLRYVDDPRLHPGFVTTSCAIQHCVDHGLDEYDHLAGNHIDKRALSTADRPLTWVRCRRRNVTMTVVDGLRRLRRAFVKRESPAAPSTDTEL